MNRNFQSYFSRWFSAVLVCALVMVLNLKSACLNSETPGIPWPGYPSAFLSNPNPGSNVPVSLNRLQYTYSGQFTQSARNQAIYSISLLQTQFGILPVGDLRVKGKITPFTPGNPIPTRMRITFRQKNAQGNVLRTKNFEFNVEADGRILLQSFPHRDVVVFASQQVLEISVVPVDKAFPAGAANLTLNYIQPPPGT